MLAENCALNPPGYLENLIMKNIYAGIIGLTVLILAAVFVVTVFSPAKPEVLNTDQSKGLRQGLDVKATPAELIEAASAQNQAGCKSDMDYMVVIACCRQKIVTDFYSKILVQRLLALFFQSPL